MCFMNWSNVKFSTILGTMIARIRYLVNSLDGNKSSKSIR